MYLGTVIYGKLIALVYMPGTIDTGAGIVVTAETTGQPIMTKTSLGTANTWYFPRNAVHTVAAGAAITNAWDYIWLSRERIKVVMASGGEVLTGSIEAYYDDNTNT